MKKPIPYIVLCGLGVMPMTLTQCASQSQEGLEPIVALDSESQTEAEETLSLQEIDEDFLNEDLEDDLVSVYDPIEPVNRVIFQVNDGLYNWVLRPLSQAYRFVMPDPVERGIGNFFDNLGAPKRLVGNALQGDLKEAGGEIAHFTVNSTIGVGGIFRPIGRPDWDPEDSGQTLGHWGVPNGPYFVLPVLGPTTLRDGTGRVADGFLNPIYYIADDEVRYALSGTERLHLNVIELDLYDGVVESAVEPYDAVRQAYLSTRRSQVGQ